MKTKSILIYSGGLDSTVLLHKLLNDGQEVRCLGVNYGQRHGKELQFASDNCNRLGVEFRVADLSSLKPLLGGSSQTDPSVAVPHGHYAEESMKLTVVPNRNALMLSCALAWAISTKSQHVAYAAHAGDHAIYPDCREEFASAFNTMALLADWHQATLLRPFVGMTKRQIAQLAMELNVDVAKTWSCYEGGDVHCGRCGTCCERLECLEGLHDDTVYADREFYKTLSAPKGLTPYDNDNH